MSFENKIANKLNEVSMTPSSDIMSMVRKKRTPFYVFKNHLSLHKVRYGAIAFLGLVALSTPFLINTDTQEGLSENNNSSSKNNMEVLKETGSDVNLERKNEARNIDASAFNSDNETIESKNEILGSMKENISGSYGIKKNVVTGAGNRDSKKDIEITEKKAGANGSNANLVLIEIENSVAQERKMKDLRYLEQREFVQKNPVSIEIASLGYLENKRQIEDRSIAMKSAGIATDLKKMGVTFLGIGAGYYWDHATYSSNEMGVKMMESTGVKSSNSYGISIGLSLYKKWTLHTGVELFTRKENFNYLKHSDNYLLNVDTVHGKVHIPGQPDKDVVRYDSSYVNDGNHKRVTALNTTSYIEVPVVFSYNVLNRNRFRVGVNPGIRVGLFQSQTGYTMNNMYETVVLAGEGAVKQYKNINMSAELGLDIDYNVAGRVNLFMQPKVRTGLGDLMQSEVGFSKNYTSFGIFGGVRYKLN